MINIIDSKSDPNINKNIFISVQNIVFFYGIYNFLDERRLWNGIFNKFCK
jgi:hypothetical protein